ncbi:MAG: helicase-exonuclease AddAB subunit AddB, partial [Clostridiales bacterium]|nr:helicase-exonuclease AddAB subunit AddB [Clostridiales bacterium]
DIETAIKKALRTKGLLLADVKLIRAMDRDLSGDSMIIPARINKGDILGRSSAASREQFGLLRSHIRKTLAGLGAEIVKGNVAASPYKKRNVTACTWCAYSAVCQFDLSLKDNKYRILRELDDDQVWNRIRNELSHDNGEDVTAVER